MALTNADLETVAQTLVCAQHVPQKDALLVTCLFGDSRPPKRAYKNDVGYDFYAYSNIAIGPGNTAMIPLGVAITPPPNYYMQLFTRSSLARRGIFSNAGVIDDGYRGQVFAILYNTTKKTVKIYKNTRIVQGVLLRTCHPKVKEHWYDKTAEKEYKASERDPYSDSDSEEERDEPGNVDEPNLEERGTKAFGSSNEE